MVNIHGVAQPAGPACLNHRAAVGSIDAGAVGVGNVQRIVVGIGAGEIRYIPVSEIGGDDAVAGPAQTAGGDPAGALLGATGLQLRHRLLQHNRFHHLAVGFFTVDIGHIGRNLCLSVDAGGQHLIIALIHGAVVLIFHRIRHILHIVLPLHIHHRQIRNRVADGQHISGVNQGHIIARVQVQQFICVYLVGCGNIIPCVAGLNRVGDGPFLCGVKLFGNIAQIHHQVGSVIFLPDFRLFHEVALHGAGGDIAHLQLIQQLLQCAFKFGGGHRLAVYIQYIAISHLPQLSRQLLFQFLLRFHIGPAHHAGGGLQQIGVDLIAVICKGGARNLLQRLGSGAHCPAGGYGAHGNAIIGNNGADGIKRQYHGYGGDGNRAAQKQSGMQLYPLKQRPAAVSRVDAAAAKTVKPLADAVCQPGKAAPDKQHQLGQPVIRFRKSAGLLFPFHINQSLLAPVNLTADKVQQPPNRALKVRIMLQKIRVLLQIPAQTAQAAAVLLSIHIVTPQKVTNQLQMV